MSIVSEIFGSGFDLYRFLTDKSKSKSSAGKLLLREIRDNLKRLEHRNRKGVNRSKLIEMLSNEQYLKAVSANFNIRRLAKGNRIDSKVIRDIPSARKYLDWDLDQLLNSIDGKIVGLKELPGLYDSLETAPVNLTSRLNNLYILHVLAGYLIRKSNG